MKTTVHGNNLIQLTFYGFVNVYLLREEDGFTVIDTALEGCAKAIVEAAQQAGSPIVRIFPTHAHTDHIGGLDALPTPGPPGAGVIAARDGGFLGGEMCPEAGVTRNKLR